MKRIWAPWRIEYIKTPKEKDCIFCKFPKEQNDRERFILHRGKTCFIIMNYFPYNNGHLMIAPYQHTTDLDDLDDQAKIEIFDLINHSTKALSEKLKSEGFNIGINLGSTAGAGINDHLHIHIVPRWQGDTNFMPVAGNTKVISQELHETWATLKEYFEQNLPNG
jgi:ATP adenylyltransferase